MNVLLYLHVLYTAGNFLTSSSQGLHTTGFTKSRVIHRKAKYVWTNIIMHNITNIHEKIWPFMRKEESWGILIMRYNIKNLHILKL
jgi:prephenate dehydrogenase